MNNEQKYNKALEQAKRELSTCGSMDCDAARLIFRLFPQLAESEEERIRWWLRSYFGTIGKNWLFDNDMPLNSILAWLEKQKEQEPITDSVKFEEGFKAGREFERREQKPSWSEEDAETLYDIIYRLDTDNRIGLDEFSRMEKLLKSLRPQPKQEWSEEDEEMRKLIGDVNDAKQLYTTSRAAKDMADKEIAWLKSLKPSEQKYTLADLEAEWKHGYDYAKKEAETAYTGDEDKADI